MQRTESNCLVTHSEWYVGAMKRLVEVVQDLSHAHDLLSVMNIVRKAARELTGADGATFVLRDNDKCYYAEENAISPLWKGQRFPMKTCISGWVMLNAKPAVIEDIYQDPRIPAEAYRPTFVKSLAMVPIRTETPIGAIGNYWAEIRLPSEEELAILQSLAHVTSVALENIELYSCLQEKIQALEKSNYELSCFAWAASHDLKAPLRGIDNLTSWIQEDIVGNDIEKTQEHIAALRGRVRRMEKLLDDILDYAHVNHARTPDTDKLADGKTLKKDIFELIDLPETFTLSFSEGFDEISVPRLALQRIFCNLIDNAIKHHDKLGGMIEVHVLDQEKHYLFSVKDDGPGIPTEYHGRIFEMFQTLKPRDVTEGSGMGLALVKKILSLYGGDIQVVSGPERGAAFRFSWPKMSEHPMKYSAA